MLIIIEDKRTCKGIMKEKEAVMNKFNAKPV